MSFVSFDKKKIKKKVKRTWQISRMIIVHEDWDVTKTGNGEWGMGN